MQRKSRGKTHVFCVLHFDVVLHTVRAKFGCLGLVRGAVQNPPSFEYDMGRWTVSSG